MTLPALLLLACASLPPPADVAEAPTRARGAAEPLPADVLRIDDRVEALRVEAGVPALGVAVVDASGLRAIGVSGRLHAGEDAAAVDVMAPWHVGSNGKAMTATVLARLVEQGHLRWDQTVGETFPDWPLHDAWRPVRLDWLLGHVGGAPANTGRLVALQLQRSPYAEAPRGARIALLQQILAEEPEHAPDTTFAYSNLGYALAGAMAEAATGEAWEALVARELLVPLSMDSAAWGPPTGEDAPWGHNFLGAVPPGEAADNPPAISPAGTLHLALSDYATFAWLHLTSGASHPGYLSASSFARLHEEGPGDYALGWNVVERGWSGGPFLTHDGSNTMWFARAVVAPGVGRAVVVVSNQGPPAGHAAVADAEKALRTLTLPPRAPAPAPEPASDAPPSAENRE
jgi:D-alanyl-D-alanine carboxypeptidase